MSPPPLAAAAAVPLSPTLDPGSLWHVGTIVGRGLVDLPNGGQEETDVEVVADEPMGIHPLTGRERAESGGILSEATHRIRLYWIAGVKPAQQVRMHDTAEDRDRTFEIVSVVNVEERGIVLDLTVVEKV
jgi:head-tail adaptor